MKPQPTPEEDDPDIGADEVLCRWCKTHTQIYGHENGTFYFSDRIFAKNVDGCSVEIQSLFAKDGETIQSRMVANNGFAAVSVKAGDVRKVAYGDPKKPKIDLKVAYTPIPPGQKFGPNPYHADIFPGPTGSANKALSGIKKVEIEIDQEQAKIHWENRHNAADSDE